MTRLLIKPLSYDRNALLATEATLKQLVGGSSFACDGFGEWITYEGGWLEVLTPNIDFVSWAAIRQGYIAAARVVDTPTPPPPTAWELLNRGGDPYSVARRQEEVLRADGRLLPADPTTAPGRAAAIPKGTER